MVQLAIYCLPVQHSSAAPCLKNQFCLSPCHSIILTLQLSFASASSLSPFLPLRTYHRPHFLPPLSPSTSLSSSSIPPSPPPDRHHDRPNPRHQTPPQPGHVPVHRMLCPSPPLFTSPLRSSPPSGIQDPLLTSSPLAVRICRRRPPR